MTTDNGHFLPMERKETLEAIELLKKLIETPRVSREETAAADLLEAFMLEKGLCVHREANNLWCESVTEKAGRPTLLLNAHIDTVRPVTAWTRDPYRATLEGDTLYGLGSNDDGASLVSLLEAFLILKDKEDLPWHLVFCASAEEEVSGKNGIERVLPLLPKIDVALVGEPTGMHPAVAEKGLMVLDITAHGKAGHAAREEGDNAIYHAIDAMEWIRNNKFEQISSLLGPVKTTVTIVNAGTQHNVIPDTCTFTVDVRSNECYSNEEIYAIIKDALPSCDVKARSFRLGSSRIEMEHPLVQKILAEGRQPFGSPTLSDQALMRFPSLKMGPGQSSRSHTADEFIRVSEIDEAIEMYIKILS